MSNADTPTGAQPPDVALPVPPEVDVDQTFDVDGLYALRSTVAAHASHAGAAGSQFDALVIIAGELATNAVRHGGGTGRIELWHDDQYLYVRITDEGPGIADTSIGVALPDPTRVGGRGMWIVRRLSKDLVINPGPAGRGACVTARVGRADGTSPA